MTSRFAGSSLGQRLPWFVAALLAFVGSLLIAAWLNATAANADRDTLSRGADALQSNVEEQLRILALGGMGTRSLTGAKIEELNLDSLITQMDYTVLSSLLGVLSYPVDENGSSEGDFLRLGVIRVPDFDSPELVLSPSEVDDLLKTGDLLFSDPFVSTDPDRLDYVMAMATDVDGTGVQLIGVAFRPDRMVGSALEAAGEGQYAARLIDARLGGRAVLSLGTPSSSLEEIRMPFGEDSPLELVIRPGPDFPFAQSPWIVILVAATGVVIALLLAWVGQMAESRSENLAERLRLAQELNESKDRFLATVSHELRTPLTVVLGIASEVGARWDQFAEEERTDLMEMMAEQAVEAANIVEDLLVAARSDPSRLRLAMEHTHLKPHVHYAITSLPDEGRKRVATSENDYPVYADTTRLRQILRNLLENAVRYGGDQVTVDAACDGNRITIVVADDGELLEADVERIFEPYEQTEGKGSDALPGVGIGLFVSRLLARLMGGDLDCVREDGWTKFRLQLPAALDEAEVETDLVSVLS